MSSEAAEKEAMEITVADLPMEFRVSKNEKFVIQNRIFITKLTEKCANHRTEAFRSNNSPQLIILHALTWIDRTPDHHHLYKADN